MGDAACLLLPQYDSIRRDSPLQCLVALPKTSRRPQPFISLRDSCNFEVVLVAGEATRWRWRRGNKKIVPPAVSTSPHILKFEDTRTGE